MGIPVLPPDINHSEDYFTVEGDGIRFGLGAVKNVGRGLIRSMVAKRQEGGRIPVVWKISWSGMGEGELNKRAVENFIKCGALDCFGYHRSELLAVYDTDDGQRVRQPEEESGRPDGPVRHAGRGRRGGR